MTVDKNKISRLKASVWWSTKKTSLRGSGRRPGSMLASEGNMESPRP